MVCLHVGHGSGSKVFQSYLDGHPQIYMIPAYPLLYLYPHWRRWETEMAGTWTWDTIIEAFCRQHASVIDPVSIPGHNGMTGLGESRNETVAIDSELFRRYLSHLLADEPVSIRTFILALHYAYAFCQGEDMDRKRILVYHIHVQAYVSAYLQPDFPDMLILGMVRDQRSNHIPLELGSVGSTISVCIYSNQLSGTIPPALGSVWELLVYVTSTITSSRSPSSRWSW